MRTATFVAVLLAVMGMACSDAFGSFVETFDGGGTVPWAFKSNSGTAPSLQVGGPTNTHARITNLNGSNNNSIAFDEDPLTTGPQAAGMRLAFDFRMTDDAANAAAAGCCGSAADGLGIGVFATARYGASGAINPGAGEGVGGSGVSDGITLFNDWERPQFADAFAIGLDIFQNIDVLSINWADAQVAAIDVAPIMDLNNNVWHRALVNVKPDGANAKVDVTILEDVTGLTTIHSIATDVAVPGLNLAALPGWRVIGGGRTGGAFVEGSLDNIAVQAVPEPASVALLGLGGLLLLAARKRK